VTSATPHPSARRITADVGIQIGSLVVNVAIGIIVTAILARQLGTDGFGEWSTIFAVFGLTGYLANLKMQEVTIREIAQAPDSESAWLGTLLSLQAVILIPVTLITIAVLMVLARNDAMRLAGVIIGASALTTMLSMTGTAFRLRVRNDLSMLVLTFNSLAWGAVVVIVAATGGGLVPFAVGFTATTVASGLLTVALSRRRATFQIRGSRVRWKYLAQASFVLGLAALVSIAHAQIDQLIVYELAPHYADAGLYGALNRVLIRALAVPEAVMTTLFPVIAAAVTYEMARARRLVQTALEYLLMVSLPAFGFTLVAAEPVLRLLYGPSFVSASDTFPVVMGSFVISCWGVVSASMVIILELQSRFVRYVVVGLCLNVALNLALVPSYGYQAAAWVTVFTEAVVIGLSMHAVLGEMHMAIRVPRLIRITAVAGVFTAALYAISSRGAGLGVLVGAAAVVYPALLLLTNTLDRGELRSLMAERSR
jgi:O-antigen/teichoic acid export membrane protein